MTKRLTILVAVLAVMFFASAAHAATTGNADLSVTTSEFCDLLVAGAPAWTIPGNPSETVVELSEGSDVTVTMSGRPANGENIELTLVAAADTFDYATYDTAAFASGELQHSITSGAGQVDVANTTAGATMILEWGDDIEVNEAQIDTFYVLDSLFETSATVPSGAYSLQVNYELDCAVP